MITLKLVDWQPSMMGLFTPRSNWRITTTTMLDRLFSVVKEQNGSTIALVSSLTGHHRTTYKTHCGAEGIRTLDPLVANQVLSQLSYSPRMIFQISKFEILKLNPGARSASEHHTPSVGLGRVERPTSRLSGVRSNHLSYRPGVVHIKRTLTHA